jgi:hypothetical protein
MRTDRNASRLEYFGHRYTRVLRDIYLLAGAPAELAARSQGVTLLARVIGLFGGGAAGCAMGTGDTNAELTARVPDGEPLAAGARFTASDVLRSHDAMAIPVRDAIVRRSPGPVP